MKPIDKGDTSYMTSEQFTASRFHGPQGDIAITIGGTDISSIFGTSPWRTALELWRTKRRAFLEFMKKPVDVPTPVFVEEENAEAKEIGHRVEGDIVLKFKRLMEREGHAVAVITDKHSYQCGEILTDAEGFPVEDTDGNPVLKYPFALANVDGLPIVDGEQVLLECKSTSPNNFETVAKWKQGIVPPYYEVQVRWYMAVMDIDVAYIICSWAYGDSDCAIVRIDRDKNFEDEIMERVTTFVQSVEDGIEPDGSDDNPVLLQKYYTKLYGAPTESKSMDISKEPEVESTIVDLARIKKEIAQTESYLAGLQNKLTAKLNEFAPLYGEYDKVVYSTDKYRCYISVVSESTRAAATEESVSAIDPAQVHRGMKFDSSTFKKSIEEEIKTKRKEASALKKANDMAGYDEKNKEVEDLNALLKASIVPPRWKGTQKISVKFYDPKDPKKQVL